MSIAKTINNIKLPNKDDLFNIPKEVNENKKNLKINAITVKYYDSSMNDCIEYDGELLHICSVPFVKFNNGSIQYVLGIKNSIKTNKTLNRKEILISEDCVYGLDIDALPIFKNDRKYYNIDYAKNIKKFVDGFKIPVIIENIPREIIRIDISKKQDGTNMLEITSNILSQLGTLKFLQRMNKPNNQVILGCMLLFIPIGIIIGFIGSIFLIG